MAKNKNADRLDRLHAVGLFTEIAPDTLPATLSKKSDPLVEQIDRVAREIRSAKLYRALQSVPPDLGIENVLVPAGPSHVRLATGAQKGIYRPERHHEYAQLVNVALAEIGDARRLVPLKTTDWEEPLFLLATVEQQQVVHDTGLEESFAVMRLSEPVSLHTHLTGLAQQLGFRLPPGNPPTVDEPVVVIDLTESRAIDLVEALYSARYWSDALFAQAERWQEPASTGLTPEAASRVRRLRELNIGPDLTDSAMEKIAAELSDEHKLDGPPPMDAGTILARHLLRTKSSGLLVGRNAPAHAARRDDVASFSLHLIPPERFLFITLPPSTRATIEREELLYLDPPIRPMPSARPDALATTIADLAGIDAGALEVVRGGDRFELRSSLEATNALIDLLPFVGFTP